MNAYTAISNMGYTGPVGRELVTAPTVPVLSVSALRSRLRVPFTDEDDQLQAFLESAVSETEEFLGRRLAPQTWRFWYDGTPRGRVITLPEPVRSVTAVKSYATDADATGTVLLTSEYVLDGQHQRVVINENTTLWPVSTLRGYRSMSIEAAVGYASTAAIPPAIVQAIHLRVAGHYLRGVEPAHEAETREKAIARLLNPHRFRMGVA
jgi:uncharacterized phiE125 gp8 family phage protein